MVSFSYHPTRDFTLTRENLVQTLPTACEPREYQHERSLLEVLFMFSSFRRAERAARELFVSVVSLPKVIQNTILRCRCTIQSKGIGRQW
jgi:hypothetical protein